MYNFNYVNKSTETNVEESAQFLNEYKCFWTSSEWDLRVHSAQIIVTAKGFVNILS